MQCHSTLLSSKDYDEGTDITLKELADEMHIARSTIGEHLKRAESEVLKRAVEDFPAVR